MMFTRSDPPTDPPDPTREQEIAAEQVSNFEAFKEAVKRSGLLGDYDFEFEFYTSENPKKAYPHHNYCSVGLEENDIDITPEDLTKWAALAALIRTEISLSGYYGGLVVVLMFSPADFEAVTARINKYIRERDNG